MDARLTAIEAKVPATEEVVVADSDIFGSFK